jgi:phosphate transport system substrate-binding protein
MKHHSLILLTFLWSGMDLLSANTILKINGSTTVNPPVAEAAEILREEKGWSIHVDTQGGSSGGFSQVAEGLAEVGMSSKPLTDSERKKHPETDFHVFQIGEDAVALVVSADVWAGGVRSLSRDQVLAIYEGKVKNWKDVGGPDRRIAFFNKEPGRGTWEVFAKWLYGDVKNAPPVALPEVGGNEEARTKLGTTRGAITQLSSSWADGKSLFALGIKTSDGELIEPSTQNIASGRYPLSRPLFLLTAGEPKDHAKAFVDFMLSPRGQEIVRKHHYLSNDQLTLTAPSEAP